MMVELARFEHQAVPVEDVHSFWRFPMAICLLLLLLLLLLPLLYGKVDHF